MPSTTSVFLKLQKNEREQNLEREKMLRLLTVPFLLAFAFGFVPKFRPEYSWGMNAHHVAIKSTDIEAVRHLCLGWLFVGQED